MSSLAPTKQTQQDVCRYWIHLNPLDCTNNDKLVQLQAQILALANQLSREYIFHKQSFNLSLTPVSFTSATTTTTNPGGSSLQGQTEVTDAVDDEWYIVWLLQQISKQFQNTVIRVQDEDGEFLLIEAAEVLPKWITPQNATNRVWIYEGQLHLVPLEHKSDLPFQASTDFDVEEQGHIDETTAISLVRDPNVATLASRTIQDVVWARTNRYPQAAQDHHHTTLAYLPVEIALALADSPHLISEAVASFYEREPDSLKHCHTMKRFPPTSPTQAWSVVTEPDTSESTVSGLPNTVLVPTRMTRPLYSQLVLQKFYSPKPFERVGWNENVRDEDDDRRRLVGMKIACGFEMLYQQTQPLVRHPTFDPTQQPVYQTYLKSLRDSGYFDKELEGSQRWKALEFKARLAWRQARLSELDDRPPFAQRVDEAIERARTQPLLPNRVTGSKLSDANTLNKFEDSEEWLSLTEQGLEDILQSKQSDNNMFDEEFSDDDDDDDDDDEDENELEQSNNDKLHQTKKEDQRAQKMAKQLEQMVGKVEEFVQGKGALEGAEFSDEQTDDDDEDEEEEEDDAPMPQMTAEERANRLEKLVAPLPIEDWGQKQPSGNKDNLMNGPNVQTRPPKLTQNKYDGASDDEDSSEDEIDDAERGLPRQGQDAIQNGQDDEEEPSVVETTEQEQEMDMGEEMDEFLKFATETLGLSTEQYEKILGERRDRGAFVPGPSKPKKINVIPSSSSQAEQRNRDNKNEKIPTKSTLPRNPNLSSFDTLMEQMDQELAKVRMARSKTNTSSSKSPMTKPSLSTSGVTIEDDDNSDIEDAGDQETLAALEEMDQELASLLKSARRAGMDVDNQDDDDEDDDDNMDTEDLSSTDLNLVKNFLSSFQSQGGFAGPAGNLVGRMGFQLPKDER
ncbi:hypothetical protein OIO90_004763 [Microbotryomycetes sp. JL221]|nr:hypothetical protein OIO90_004763 [Microbotryomycetes sp. JL221]